MSAVNFLDSNVIIYLFDSTNDGKRKRSEAIVEDGIKQGTVCISYQVVQETLNVMLRKINMSREEIEIFFNDVLAPL